MLGDQRSPDKDALKREAARVALLRHRIHVALAVAAGRVLEAWPGGRQLGQLQQVCRSWLHCAQEGVQPACSQQVKNLRSCSVLCDAACYR